MTEKPKEPYLDEDVVGKKEKLVELLKQKSEVYDRIKEIYHMYNLPKDWLKRLPAESLQELHTTLSKGGDVPINLFELRSKLRKEHLEGTEELDKLEREISMSRLELLLANIECIQKNLKDR